MFTLKFYKGNSRNVLSSPHYNIIELGDCTEITLYKDMTTQNGVTYRVGTSLPVPHFDQLFIENSSGKTIDNIQYFEKTGTVGLGK